VIGISSTTLVLVYHISRKTLKIKSHSYTYSKYSSIRIYIYVRHKHEFYCEGIFIACSEADVL